jgi:hypothetical protein
MRNKMEHSVRTLTREFKAEGITALPNSLELNKYAAIQLLHEKAMARRRRELSESDSNKFKITALSDLPIDEDVPEDELEAEKIVTHKRVVLTDSKLNVIHGHETVLKHREDREPVLVLKIQGKLTEKDIFLLQVRHAAKEGLLFAAIRMEAIRILHDKHGLDLKQIQLLLVGPKGKKPTLSNVYSELNVGQLYEKYPGFKIPFKGYELDKKAFSNLKYLCGHKDILEFMSHDAENEQHFLKMAINQTWGGGRRLNTEIPPLLKHEDTKRILFTQGLDPAKGLMKAKYPEENTDLHPLNDLKAANGKFQRPDFLHMLKGQFEKRTSHHPILEQTTDIVTTIMELSPKAGKEILRRLLATDPSSYAEVLIQQDPDLAINMIGKFGARYTELASAIK